MILLTGGSGLLGRELRKYLKCYAPSHKKLDITKKIKPMKDISMIIHCAGYTDVAKAEKQRKECDNVNIKGTANLLKAYPNTPFIFISTEYVYTLSNWYALSKYKAESLVEGHDKHLIIRTSFSPRPFPHKYAFFDQYTKGDYVDIIAPLIIDVIARDKWDCVVNVGTGRKTMLELARQTKPKIKGISVDDIKSVKLPKDYDKPSFYF